MRFSSSIHNPRSAIRAKRPGFALPMTIIAIAGLTLLLIGLLTVISLERKTARSYSDSARADLAVESGLAVATEQITRFLKRTDVTGAAFTTWAYHPGGVSTPGSLLALTSGRPEFDIGTTAGSPYLSTTNTTWLGTAGDDPDKLFADFASGSKDVFNFNAKNALGTTAGACLARWQNFGTDPEGRQIRYAVWVDDETARLDVTQIGGADRVDGNTPSEFPFFDIGKLAAADAAKQASWRTGDSPRTRLDQTKFPQNLSGGATAFSRGYDVLAHTPSFAQEGAFQRNGYQLPLRGTAKRNLNWSGHIASTNTDDRVERLAEWMANGAKGFFNKRNLNLWSGSGAALPIYQTLPTSNPFASDLRREQFRTISASLIDYLDTDNIPTQPASLAVLNYGNPTPLAAPVLLMKDVPRPGYFGADRTLRINEAQIIWNSRGAADSFRANNTVTRTSLGGGLFRYEIPVTYRIEVWNMDQTSIPASAYEVRTTYMQQILGSTFGSTGALPIPEETEMVLQLNSGNPIAFAPNEIKVFDITRTYTRTSNLDRGTTWDSFRLGGSGTGDDQPDGHQRQAHVLLNSGSGRWLHATNYLQMTEAPTDGVVSAGPGNRGASKGNQLNDPRLTPLRMYYIGVETNHDADRDWSGNKPGHMGTVNNGGSAANVYQDFNFWLDRPHLLSISAPLQGITRIENSPMKSVGELGRIFDPAWTHPSGRGNSGSAFNQGVLSPFRGGGTLAIGQDSKATPTGTSAPDHLDAKPWNIMDIFAVKGDGSSMQSDEYADLEWKGRINLNCQKTLPLTAGTKSNHELAMQLPKLRLGAAGRPEQFKFSAAATELKNRLTKGGNRPDGTTVKSWKDALPLYSPGQLSELKSWNDIASYTPAESTSSGVLTVLNRTDAAREEAMMRTASIVTTRSHCFRIVTAGEVLSSNGQVLARRLQENVIFFKCTWKKDTGELLTVEPQTLYARSL
jgi:hypothetical protein